MPQQQTVCRPACSHTSTKAWHRLSTSYKMALQLCTVVSIHHHLAPSQHPIPSAEHDSAAAPSAHRSCPKFLLVPKSLPTFILAKASLSNMPLVLSVSGTLIVICRVAAAHASSCQPQAVPDIPHAAHVCQKPAIAATSLHSVVRHQQHTRLCSWKVLPGCLCFSAAAWYKLRG